MNISTGFSWRNRMEDSYSMLFISIEITWWCPPKSNMEAWRNGTSNADSIAGNCQVSFSYVVAGFICYQQKCDPHRCAVPTHFFLSIKPVPNHPPKQQHEPTEVLSKGAVLVNVAQDCFFLWNDDTILSGLHAKIAELLRFLQRKQTWKQIDTWITTSLQITATSCTEFLFLDSKTNDSSCHDHPCCKLIVWMKWSEQKPLYMGCSHKLGG